MQLNLPNEKPEDIKEDRDEALKECRETFPDLETHFGPGSFGLFEVIDRSLIVFENWSQYVASHPAVVLDEDLYEQAHKIESALFDFYQKVAVRDFNAEEAQEALALKEFAKWAKGKGTEIDELVREFKKERQFHGNVSANEKDSQDSEKD